MALTLPTLNSEVLELLASMTTREEIERHITQEDLFNARDSCEDTLLHMAARTKNTEIAKFLINSGSKVDVQNKLGQTPLMLAIIHDSQEIIANLIETGANIDMLDYSNKNILQILAESTALPSDKVLELVLEKLQINCSNNREEIAKKLFDAKWPLHNIVRLKNADLTKIILDLGYPGDINATTASYFHWSALHYAVQTVNLENIKLLLKHNANVNVVDSRQRTPLSYLYDYKDSYNQYAETRLFITKMLLERGAMLIVGNSNNIYGTYHVFEQGSREIIRLLLQTDIDLSASDRYSGDTVVHALARNKNCSVIEELRGKKFVVDARDWYGATPLMTAASCGNAIVSEFLLKKKANVNAIDHQNASAIHYAMFWISSDSEKKYKDCVQVLLEYGANVQLVTRSLNAPIILETIWNKKFFLVGDIVLSHLALEEAQGTYIGEYTRLVINSKNRFKSQFEFSKVQLKMEVYQSMNLFEFLTITDRKFQFYVRKEELISKIRSAVCASSRYDFFSKFLQKRLSKALTMNILKKEAGPIISKIMGVSYDGFPLIVDEIVSFLEQEDMENLMKAYQIDNHDSIGFYYNYGNPIFLIFHLQDRL